MRERLDSARELVSFSTGGSTTVAAGKPQEATSSTSSGGGGGSGRDSGLRRAGFELGKKLGQVRASTPFAVRRCVSLLARGDRRPVLPF
jgi:hypothetical protein